jgi:hypothetical protein
LARRADKKSRVVWIDSELEASRESSWSAGKCLNLMHINELMAHSAINKEGTDGDFAVCGRHERASSVIMPIAPTERFDKPAVGKRLELAPQFKDFEPGGQLIDGRNSAMI